MPSITVQPELLLERILTLEIVRVTERAAVSSARLRGHGKDKASDQAAVDAMSLDFHLTAPEMADGQEIGAHRDRREQLVTVVAASLAVLIVAAIAVLMGVA